MDITVQINCKRMKKIVAIIEKADDGGYSIYAADDNVPVVGSGMTEQEARQDFEEVMAEQAGYMKKQTGVYPEWHGAEVEYRYDMSGFFLKFPFINATEFARCVGINPSLMRKYKNGLAAASERQKNLIQKKFTEIVNQLERVRFT